MKFKNSILISGCTIFLFTTLGMLFQEAVMVMLFILFVPGPVLGLIIALFKKSTILQKVLFILATIVTYYFALYFIDIEQVDYKLSPTKILLASFLSAILLQILFDIIFKSAFTIKDTLLRPAILGVAASIITTITAFLFKKSPTSGWVTIPLWLGLFSIFPLYYSLFARHLVRTGKVSS